MILQGARVALGESEGVRLDLTIRRGKVWFGKHAADGPALDLHGHLILPGLINAHDHLEFNLFRRLGSPPYANATEWALDIYRPDRSPVREQLRIPKSVRLRWGGVKNLLSGVTTVMHHNPYETGVFGPGFPVRVVSRYGWAHSPRFSPDFRKRYTRAPFAIHACEGSDAAARREAGLLEEAGVLGENTVMVHGVALDEAGIALMKRRGAGLVWCPSSNLFTLGQTISKQVLDSGIPMALGTDSALTAAGDLLDELRVAAAYATPQRLYRMVTRDAARLLHLEAGEGEIREGGRADLLVLRDLGVTPAEALLSARPEMVIIGGKIHLLALESAPGGAGIQPALRPLRLEGRGTFLARAAHGVPEGSRLAGKKVAA